MTLIWWTFCLSYEEPGSSDIFISSVRASNTIVQIRKFFRNFSKNRSIQIVLRIATLSNEKSFVKLLERFKGLLSKPTLHKSIFLIDGCHRASSNHIKLFQKSRWSRDLSRRESPFRCDYVPWDRTAFQVHFGQFVSRFFAVNLKPIDW